MELSLPAAHIFGIVAIALHAIAYSMYAIGVLRSKIKPNAATWFMWLIGGIVEFATYNAIAGAHWTTSGLPFVCVLGLATIFIATIISQVRENRREQDPDRVYYKPEPVDYVLMAIDLGSGAYWLFGGSPSVANIVAVGSSFVTFYPLWRTTYMCPQGEEMGPWIVWSFAYLAMMLAVVFVGSEELLARLFYPAYYLVLHAVVAGIIVVRRKST